MHPDHEFVQRGSHGLLPPPVGVMTIAPQEMHRVPPYSKRPRRRAEEVERYYRCNYPDCDKAYGALNHLNTHVRNAKHGPKREPKALKLRKKREQASENSALRSDVVYQSGPQLSVPGEPYESPRVDAPTYHPQERASEHPSSRGDVVYHPGPQLSVPGEPHEYPRLDAPTYHTQHRASENSSLRSDVIYQSAPQHSVPGDTYEYSRLEALTYHTATLHAPRTQSAGYFPYPSDVASVGTQHSAPSEERRRENWCTPPPSDPIHSEPWSPDNYHNLTTRHPTFAGYLHTRPDDATSSPREAPSGSAWHDGRSNSQYPRHYIHRPNGSVHPRDPYRSYVRKEFRG